MTKERAAKIRRYLKEAADMWYEQMTDQPDNECSTEEIAFDFIRNVIGDGDLIEIMRDAPA